MISTTPKEQTVISINAINTLDLENKIKDYHKEGWIIAWYDVGYQWTKKLGMIHTGIIIFNKHNVN